MPHCCEYRSQYGDVDDYGVRAAMELESVILREGPDSVGAVILEPITAGGGVITPPTGYWETIQEICRRHGLLLIIDEVVCGVGRTGKWFGYQHYGVQPDIVTMAKGVASGYAAISCTVTTEAVFELFKEDADDRLSYFRDVSTFGGCAGGPAAALENMRIIESEGLLENVTTIGEYFKEQLFVLRDKHEIIGDVRGKGLFAGLELVRDRETKEPVPESVAVGVAAECMKQGVIIGRTNRSFRDFNNTLAFSPALIATKDDIDEIIAAVDRALRAI
jgi:taurine-pyruvate aminotransferase